MGSPRPDQDRSPAILAMEHRGQFDPSRTDRRYRFLPQWRRGLCPGSARRDTAAPPGDATGMRRSGAVPCIGRVELHQRRRDRHRRRLYRRRHREPAQPRTGRFRRPPQLSANASNARPRAQSSRTRRIPSSMVRISAVERRPDVRVRRCLSTAATDRKRRWNSVLAIGLGTTMGGLGAGRVEKGVP